MNGKIYHFLDRKTHIIKMLILPMLICKLMQFHLKHSKTPFPLELEKCSVKLHLEEYARISKKEKQ